ncbi:multiple epidermal growth factor-like domains protein 8 [Bolinopsis microptera]|uniref:multiple epidermal growth factor-like domains protein 8 n=1 Tax=Bolinopsis microptera TaxID=2820187 RepID=UPI00307A0AA7
MVDRLYLVIAVLLSLVISFDGSPRKVIFDKWSGNITSNPGNKYLKNQEYEWLIKVPVGGNFIELKFPAFLTECLYDYVSVYNNNDEDNRLQLAAISGNLRSMEDIVSDTGQMYIHLTSDADRVFRGFKATFSVTICPNNCTGSNGRCNPNSNKCTCNTGWYGDKCDKGALDCGSHGQLDTLLNKCRCNEGYFGWKCNIKLISKAEEPPYNSWFSLVQPESRQSILSWDQAKRMLPRQGHTADVIGDYLYVFGGYDLNLVLYSFKRLHVVSGDWSDVPISPASSSLPGGRYMHSSAVFGDSILYCGGFFKSTTTIGGDCWLYNTSDSCWYQYPSLPVPVTGHTTTVVPAGNVYLFGGLTGGDTDHYSCSLHTMDLSSRSPVWGLVTPTIYKCSEIRRYGHSAVYDEDSGSIVVFGGFVPIPHVRYDKSSDVLLFSIKNKIYR